MDGDRLLLVMIADCRETNVAKVRRSPKAAPGKRADAALGPAMWMGSKQEFNRCPPRE